MKDIERRKLAAEASRLSDLAQRLLDETARLRGDVSAIGALFRGFEIRKMPEDLRTAPAPIRSFVASMAELTAARHDIRHAEYALNAIRGFVEGISNDAISREEMKEWLKSATPRE